MTAAAALILSCVGAAAATFTAGTLLGRSEPTRSAVIGIAAGLAYTGLAVWLAAPGGAGC